MIKAVLFDLDETLLDRTTSLKAFLADQYARHVKYLGDVSLADWSDRFLALDQRGQVPKSTVYPALLAEFNGAAERASALLAEYRLRCSLFAKPFDGMEIALEGIRRRGARIGIVTNGETDFQTHHIKALGLDRLVDEIFISEREGLRKPEAALFHRAAAALGVLPGDCLFVGDNPVADILGAAAAGMRTAWFHGAGEWPSAAAANPGATIDNLVDVLELMKHGERIA